jgi:hypothetical protein
VQKSQEQQGRLLQVLQSRLTPGSSSKTAVRGHVPHSSSSSGSSESPFKGGVPSATCRVDIIHIE